MKSYIYTLFISLMFFSSCADELDIFSGGAVPPSSVTEKDLPALRLGMYYSVQNLPKVRSFIMFDILGGCLEGTTGNYRDVINGMLSPLNSTISDSWNGYFDALYQVNNVLDITDRYTSSSALSTKGEALYFRAYIYFCLASRWGDVPIIKQNTFEKVSRNPIAEVWSFIDSDLAEAHSLLPETSQSYYYVSKNAATALRARVALSRGNMNDAKKYAEELINVGSYGLDSFEKIFRKTANTEIIFAFENLTEESGINISDLFYTYEHPNKGQGAYKITRETEKLFADEDKRKDITIINLGGRPCINKYPSGQTGRDPVIISRIAEMYLISAEAQGLGNGIGRLNELRRFRGLTDINPANTNAFIDAVLEERNRELLGESFRYHDLVRTGKAVEKLGILPHQTLLPIPGKELQLNPNLTPNPGY